MRHLRRQIVVPDRHQPRRRAAQIEGGAATGHVEKLGFAAEPIHRGEAVQRPRQAARPGASRLSSPDASSAARIVPFPGRKYLHGPCRRRAGRDRRRRPAVFEGDLAERIVARSIGGPEDDADVHHHVDEQRLRPDERCEIAALLPPQSQRPPCVDQHVAQGDIARSGDTSADRSREIESRGREPRDRGGAAPAAGYSARRPRAISDRRCACAAARKCRDRSPRTSASSVRPRGSNGRRPCTSACSRDRWRGRARPVPRQSRARRERSVPGNRGSDSWKSQSSGSVVRFGVILQAVRTSGDTSAH